MTTTQKVVSSMVKTLKAKHQGDLLAMLKEVKGKIDDLDYRLRLAATKEAEVAFSIQQGLELAKKVFATIQKEHKKNWAASQKVTP